MTPLRVLYVASECAPLLKVGGLADVAAALPGALAGLGVDVRVLIPRIAGMPAGDAEIWSGDDCRLTEIRTDTGVPTWLLDTPRFRHRSALYADRDGRPYADDAECAAQFCRVAIAVAGGFLGLDWRPDVVHCNEWQTALVPLLLLEARIPAASVLTIHNLAHQGVFPLEMGERLGLPRWALQPQAAEYWGQLSFLKAGLVFADRLTTVSPGYAAEILTPAFGAGLDGVLHDRAQALTGILNGLDDAVWDPGHDPLIETHYDAARLQGKRAARRVLLEALGWSDDDAPLAAMIGRIAPQKGTDIVLEALPRLVAMGLRLVLLGSGDPDLERPWRVAAERYPGRVAVRTGFDEALAHRIYAGSDLLLMPSCFEPCGLAQMIAMRYGTLPVVNPVGGLADTVVDAGAGDGGGVGGDGFWMTSADPVGLVEACGRALAMRADPPRWSRLVRRAMRRRFDWKASAARHLEVYHAALATRAPPLDSPPARQPRASAPAGIAPQFADSHA